VGEGARSVAAEVQRLVDEGTVTRVATNIEDTTADAAEISERVKQIVQAGDVEALVKNLAETSRSLNEFGVQLSKVVEEGITPRISQLNRIFQNFERFSKVLADVSEGESGTVSETLTNLRNFSRELAALVQSSRSDVQGTISSVRGTLEKAQDSLTKLDDTLENMRAISQDLRAGKGTIGRLLTDDRLVEEVEEVITDTKEFVKSYTLMQTEVQLQSSYYVLDESAKNVFSIKFRPKVDKYYLLQVVDDPRGRTYERLVVTETNDPTMPAVLKERVETTTHDLKFSFQFAKSFYFLTGRFGIMESTGGIGLDFNFFKDRLAFQFDLFDFTLDNNPRLRTQVEWEVFRHFFVAGGADDLLNDRFRDYYFSAGVRFTDSDLKALLLASPPISP
jgi:phospholipid/cholesterol/gamma-HCH transport system substrate-binding protein